MQDFDVCVAGAGIIGLSIALELERRGARVTVVERGRALAEASQTAAGMLAVDDPDNPPEIHDLSRLSYKLYPDFLERIEALSGIAVPFQTSLTLQAIGSGEASPLKDLPVALTPGERVFRRLAEHSVDPRQVAAALLGAVRASSIRLLEETTVRTASESSTGVAIQTSGDEIHAGHVVFATGAWNFAPVRPCKGQMLAVRMPAEAHIDYVVRTPEIYVVPRLHGPRAGQAVIGATVEDAGFSTTTDAASLAELRRLAAELLPVLGDEARCPTVDYWAGLRPDTPDHLPLIGWARDGQRTMLAAGHYRNGILLAPGTAHIVAQMLLGEDAAVDLKALSPERFA